VYLRAQNVVQGLAEVQNLVGFCERMATFMVGIEHAAGPLDAALPAIFGGMAAEAKNSEVLALYRVLLLHYLEELSIGDEESKSLGQLRAVLSITEAESASVYQAAAGPLFRKAVTQAISAEELGEAQKAELQSSIASLGLPSEVVSAISVEVYTNKLKSFVGEKDESKIMSDEQAAELSKLRDFLGIRMDDVYDVHEELCSPAYRNSVQQVMGTTGIIPDEYWEGLTRLRERLGISEESAQALFGVEVTVKLKAFGTKAVDAMQAKQEAEQKKANGDDSGALGVEGLTLTTEILNMVDFAMAAKAIVTKEAAGKEFEVCGASLRGEFEVITLKQLYRSYLVEAFSSSNAAENQRLFDNLNRLALILGLEQNEIAQIHNEIGSQIYRNYISKALQKGPLGTEETQFLASIKDALDMEQARCDELIKEQELNRVSFMIEQMFEKSAVVAEDVRKMRDTADLFDIDLVDDLQVSEFRLDRLFLCELEDLVDNEQLKKDDFSALEEILEPLHISEEKCQKMLEQTVQKRTDGGVLQAAALLRQNSNAAACAELTNMLKFAALLDITAKSSVSAGERNELFMLYQAANLGGDGTDATATDKVELLKQVMGLAAPAAA